MANSLGKGVVTEFSFSFLFFFNVHIWSRDQRAVFIYLFLIN